MKDEVITIGTLDVEEGHMYIIHMEGEGSVTVKNYNFNGGAMQIIEKK